MKKVNLIFGTVYGSAQFVAETLQQDLEEQNYEVLLHQSDELVDFIPSEDELLLIVCSTTGQGDLPDDIQPWFNDMREKAPYLPQLEFGLIGLGDSTYEVFCGAIEQVNALLEELGATRIGDILKIDAGETMEPEVDAQAWLTQWCALINAS